jgi:hypothetical protein
MRPFVLAVLLLAAAPAFGAEKHVGGNTDGRTTLAFKAPDATVKKLLPAGWELDAASSGPAKDVSLRLTFIERYIGHAADGRPIEPSRVATLSIPASKTGADAKGTMLFLIYNSSPAGAPGPYGVAVHADFTMEKKHRIDPAGTTTVEESWEIRSKDGDSIQMQIQYVRGAAAYSKAENLMYSAAKPDFYRIYRSEQVTDVLRGPDVDRVQKFTFKASGPKLSPLFDGNDKLISITSVPWYARQTYLPGM